MTLPAVPFPGGSRVRHVKQLQTGSRTASVDCGPAGLLMALQAASGRSIRVPRDLQADWIAALRREMPHGPTWPATRLDGLRTAVLSDLTTGAFLAAGGKRRPVSGRLTMTYDQVVSLLERGRSVVVAVSYAAVNDLMPALSGSTTWRGGHAIALQGLVSQHGVDWTHLGDPLHDGRRPGIPRGWQTVRVRRYLRAASAWGGVGAGRAAVLWIAPAEDL